MSAIELLMPNHRPFNFLCVSGVLLATETQSVSHIYQSLEGFTQEGLSMDKQLLILFGKTGVGKNFVARLFERELGYYWYDADIDLTQEMLYAINHKLAFTAETRARYFEIVTKKIKSLLPTAEKIVVTQGLFKNINRHDLMQKFPWAQWIWVEAEQNVIEERVARRNSMVTPAYARKINAYFEKPDFRCHKILNNKDEFEVLKQALLIERIESSVVLNKVQKSLVI
jgi:gluconate kinase